MLIVALNICSIMAALIAAYYWFMSTRVNLPDKYNITVVIPKQQPLGGIDVKSSGIAYSEDFNDLAAGLRYQSRLNMKGSASACIAAVFQGLALLIPLF
ncbi:MAG: hypothetical protein WC665_05610 [Sulfurimonas sp.]|jgi:hypothetical protein